MQVFSNVTLQFKYLMLLLLLLLLGTKIAALGFKIPLHTFLVRMISLGLDERLVLTISFTFKSDFIVMEVSP